jgi:hypothetical protein
MPTREEVYTAIRNADAAGDSAGVRKLGDYLKTLPAEQSDAAPPVDVDAHRKRLGQIQEELQQIEADKPGLVGNVLGFSGNFLKGAADTALNLGSSMVATPAAGIAGILTAPAGFIPGDGRRRRSQRPTGAERVDLSAALGCRQRGTTEHR